MAKENINYHKLMMWHGEIQQVKQNDSIFGRFFRAKIDEFYKHNHVRINSFIDRKQNLDKQWFEHDKDGRIVYEGEGKEKHKKLLEGKVLADYEVANKNLWDEIMVVEI